MSEFTSDESLRQWLIRNYKRYFKSKCNDANTIITDLRNKGFSDSRIVDFAKANNDLCGLEFI